MKTDSRFMTTFAAGALALALLTGTSDAERLHGAKPATHPPCQTGAGRGDPRAVPPILPPMSCTGLRLLRRQEALEAAEFAYRLPAHARYSPVELDIYPCEPHHDPSADCR